jgi:hypothetical protein
MSNVSTASAGERGVNRDKPSHCEVPDHAKPPKREGNNSNYEMPRGMPAPPMGRS